MNLSLKKKRLNEEPQRSMLKLYMFAFRQQKAALFGLLVILVFCGIALSADLIADALNLTRDGQDILNRYGDPSPEHLLGTDEAGRDVLVRLVYGTRVSLAVALLVSLSSAVIGITVGSIAGYFGGLIDHVLMRVTDSLLALPIIPVLIILASVDHRKLPFLAEMPVEYASILKMIAVLMTFSWMIQARLLRSEILALREQDFVLAAKTQGVSEVAIIIRDVLPNVVSPVIVSISLNIGQAILFESALSFLGLGIQPPTPSWGNMLTNAQEIVYNAPLLAVLPGVLILIVVVSFNFLGDGLQAAMNPRSLNRDG